MIRVLYIIDGLHGGGKERQLVELLRAFNSMGEIIPGVITFNKNRHYSEIVKKLVPYYVELRKRPTRLEPLCTIWLHIMRFKPDIIHTWDSLSSFYSWVSCKFFSINFIDGSIRDAGLEQGWQFNFKRFFLKRADLIIANSYAGLQAYNVIGKVVYNAINTERFYTNEGVNDFNIVMTANFTDYKDHSTFFATAVRLAYDGIVDYVYLLGDGKHRQKYQDWLKNTHPVISSRFIFAGAVKNVEEYLAKCKVGVLCSTIAFKEGVSNAVLEYMAAGLVAIATDVGGSAEIISNSKNGFLVTPEQPEEIVSLIKQIKNRQINSERIIINAYATVESKFSFIKNTEQLIDTYKSLTID